MLQWVFDQQWTERSCTENGGAVEQRWPESRFKMPRVAHELPPVHRGVVDGVVFLLVGGAFVVQSRRAFLTRPNCRHPWGKKSWGGVRESNQSGRRFETLHCSRADFSTTSCRAQHISIYFKERGSAHIQIPACPSSITRINQIMKSSSNLLPPYSCQIQNHEIRAL